MTASTIKVFLVDDHAVVIDVLIALLGNEPEIEIAGRASNGQILIQQLAHLESQYPDRLPIDVILTDIRMPVLDGIEATAIVKQRYPHIKVLLLTMFEESHYLDKVKQVGADGYISKNKGKKEFVEGIKRVHDGEFVLFADLKV